MRIAVLGCGNMGRAVIEGLVARHGSQVTLWAYDKRTEACRDLKGVEVRPPQQWFGDGDGPEAVVIAVKPQDVAAALEPFSSKDVPQSLWVSIVAGLTLARLKELLGESARIVRAMPNTPALVGEGASAFSLGNGCTGEDAVRVRTILEACGRTVEVPESLMDVVTGLSGSGPAYVYLFIEALTEAGVTAGLPYALARELAAQTVVGAGRMVLEGDEVPAELKARVMSPGGTTAAGLRELERCSFKHAVMEAVLAATRRAGEIGRG